MYSQKPLLELRTVGISAMFYIYIYNKSRPMSLPRNDELFIQDNPQALLGSV